MTLEPKASIFVAGHVIMKITFILQFFKHFSDFNILTSFNQFWDVVKPLFSNKKLDSDDHISINNQDKIANNDVKLVELFTSYFINAVENTKGKTLTNLGDFSNQQNNTNN